MLPFFRYPIVNRDGNSRCERLGCTVFQAKGIKTIFCISIAASLLLTAGCQEAAWHEVKNHNKQLIKYISTDEFSESMTVNDKIILVEFCVPHGCFRCDEMRQHINRLATNEQDRTLVQRINLTHDHALASQLGVTICPSYVAFRNGEEIFRTEYPTTGDLIAVELDRAHQSTITK